MLVLVVAIVMVVFAAHIRWWWSTGAAIAVLGGVLVAFPIPVSSLEAWFVLEVLVGPAPAVVAVGAAALLATLIRRRQLVDAPEVGGARPAMAPVAESLAPRSKRTSDLGLAGYERRRSRASEVQLAQLRLHESQP